MRRISPSFVISIVALIVAMSGTAYAANELSRNSVSTKALKKNAVTTPKIKNDAVTGAKIKDGTLTSDDFAAGTLLQGPKGETGAEGPAGPQGTTGPQGDTGPAGQAGLSASAAFVDLVSPEQAITGTLNPVMTLSSPSPLGATTGTLTVDHDARLTFSADIALVVTSSMDGGLVQCNFEYRRGSGSWTDVLYSWNSFATMLPLTSPDTNAQTLSLVGAQIVSAGTYDIRVQCLGAPFAGQLLEMNYVGGQMTVTASAQ